MSKIKNISGFPEWLPAERAVEENIVSKINEIYASHGFSSIETPSVELLSTLTNQGVINKEIYVLRRAAASDDKESELALHFDLTVPFARYVAQHFSEISFPFKRQTLQKVWRGDRPQRGRFREFYQYDIDIVVRDDLPMSCDAEVVTVMEKVFRKIGLLRYEIRLNNRKLLLGFYESLGLSEELQKQVLVIVDKIDKIGPKGVSEELQKTVNLSLDKISKILDLAQIKFSAGQVEAELAKFDVNSAIFEQGRRELIELIGLLTPQTKEFILVDLSLARGLGYYTGAVFEILLPDFPAFGSAAGGGRYENLTAQFMKQSLPAVGASFGLTRIMELLISENIVTPKASSRSKVLVTVYNEEQRGKCNEIAEMLREAGVAAEVYYKSPKLGKQIEYADAKGIPFALFVNAESGVISIKDLLRTEQTDVADLEGWAKNLK